MIVDPATQRALFQAAARQAVEDLTARLQLETEHLIELAERRAFDDVGLEEYGDTTWHLPDELKIDEADAELADAIFYQVTHIQSPVVAVITQQADT